MVFSDLNELLTSCQLHMQMREAAIERWLYLELKSATLECYEINHSCFNSCLYPCVSCHVWVFFHCNTYHIRKALWEFWRCLERSFPKSLLTFSLAYTLPSKQVSFSISAFLGTWHPGMEQSSLPSLCWCVGASAHLFPPGLGNSSGPFAHVLSAGKVFTLSITWWTPRHRHADSK